MLQKNQFTPRAEERTPIKLSAGDKSDIRRYLLELRSAHPGPHSREKAFLQELYGCSRQAIDGVDAQITKDLERGFAGISAVSVEEKKVLCKILTCKDRLCTSGELTSHLIQEISADAGVDSERLLKASLKLLDLKQQEPDENKDSRHNPRDYTKGDSVVYNTPRKARWREHWGIEVKEYLGHLTADELSKVKVLCLPSRNPGPELSIYLDCGISPNQIYAVEGGNSAVRKEFAAKLSDPTSPFFGTNIICDTLENYLPNCQLRFNVVSLDFHGHMSMGKLLILGNLNLTDNALVMINAQAAREKSDMQEFFLRSAGRNQDIETEVQRLFYLSSGKSGTAHELYKKQATILSLPETRDTFFDKILLTDLGIDHEIKHGANSELLSRLKSYVDRTHYLRNPQIQRLFPRGSPGFYVLNMVVQDLSKMAFRDMIVLAPFMGFDHERSSDLAAKALLFTPHIVTHGLIRPLVIKSIKRWDYISDSGKGGQKYTTTIGRMSRPKGFYNEILPIAILYGEALANSMESMLSGGSFKPRGPSIWDPKLKIELRSGSFEYDERIKMGFSRAGVRPKKTINFGTYIRKLEEWGLFVHRCDTECNTNSFPRVGRYRIE